MKKNVIYVVGGCLLVSMSIFAQGPQTFTGEIMDSQCAALGGHQVMMQKGESPKDCTNRCVKLGGMYTLFDAGTKTVYQLDDQKKAVPFAGAKVTVTGTLNTSTKTIHVTGIKAAS
jgi:tartrate dehydratase beta subunit/fumarate hydratase class I family protein